MLQKKDGTHSYSPFLAGKPWPLGSSITPRGVNFAVTATDAKKIELLLFSSEDADEASTIIELNKSNHNNYYWHIEVIGIGEGALYGYRVFKDSDLDHNISKKILLDPCARGITGWNSYERSSYLSDNDNIKSCLKGIVCEREEFDFASHPRPQHKWSNTIIYELHVGGFTKGEKNNLEKSKRGTLLALKEKIPYLKELGITTLELLPIFAFDPSDAPPGRKNFWGYSPINWFTLHHEYILGDNPLEARNQARELVAECHDNNIEVLLDVVYNHTSEGNKEGPIISWKGFADYMYYHRNQKGEYLDVTGCGNSISANSPIARKLIIESMKCWSKELGFDGFRFDLGIALSRGKDLIPLENPPLFEDIESEPELCGLKLISEPWDCAGLYKLSDFPANNIATWNGHFRDDIRRFWKGDKNSTWPLKDRLNGSSLLYKKSNSPKHSINFITSHDGFTLHDLVSFNKKHNFANGENNRDGDNNNNSWNHGTEGPSNHKELISLRNRQKRNFLTTLLLAPGIPMLLMGDEFSRSQGGNNNSWCQDNPIGWMNWDSYSSDKYFRNFIKKLLLIRKSLPELFSPEFSFEEKKLKNQQISNSLYIQWHGINLNSPDWSDWSHTISYSLQKKPNTAVMWLGLNAYSKNMKFDLPQASSNWVEVVNTNSTGNPRGIKEPLPSSQKHLLIESRTAIMTLTKEYASRLKI